VQAEKGDNGYLPDPEPKGRRMKSTSKKGVPEKLMREISPKKLHQYRVAEKIYPDLEENDSFR
jgi:hypothetical protein